MNKLSQFQYSGAELMQCSFVYFEVQLSQLTSRTRSQSGWHRSCWGRGSRGLRGSEAEIFKRQLLLSWSKSNFSILWLVNFMPKNNYWLLNNYNSTSDCSKITRQLSNPTQPNLKWPNLTFERLTSNNQMLKRDCLNKYNFNMIGLKRLSSRCKTLLRGRLRSTQVSIKGSITDTVSVLIVFGWAVSSRSSWCSSCSSWIGCSLLSRTPWTKFPSQLFLRFCPPIHSGLDRKT